MRRRAINLLAAAPPLLLAILVGRLWLTGTLGYYVNSRTVWVVLVGAILFALIGVVAVRSALEDHDRGPSWRTAIFLVPVLLGLLVPARPLSAATGQASSLGSLRLASHVSSGTPGDSFGYWISAISAHADPGWWAGRQVTLVGFVSEQSGLPPRGFLVARFLVTCCVVDASLLGFPVQLARGKVPPQGAWVQVSGVFGHTYWTDPSGTHWPLVLHARISPVTVPSTPYLSP